MTLPAKFLSGGLHTLVQKRLKALPAGDIALLQFAAVIARVVDLNLMANAFPNQDLNGWLLRGSDAHLFEVSENKWQFTHDKVRAVILDEVGFKQRCALHRQVAALMESLYGVTPTNAAELSYHWLRAINHDAPDPAIVSKALRTQEAAAEFALSVFAYHEAGVGFNRLIELANQYASLLTGSDVITNEERGTWHMRLGWASNAQTIWSEGA